MTTWHGVYTPAQPSEAPPVHTHVYAEKLDDPRAPTNSEPIHDDVSESEVSRVADDSDALLDAPNPTHTKLIPRDYQAYAIKRMRELGRCLLWDQPGLGKTLCASEAAEWPILVAAPTYLVYHWLDHLQRQYPEKRVVAAVGNRSQKEGALATPADAYIINVEMLRSFDLPRVQTFILDEAHHIRGRNSKQSRGAHDYAQVTPRVFLLTATPIYKAPDDLFAIFRCIDPKGWTSYHQFVSTYCRTYKGRFGLKVIGVANHENLQRTMSRYGLGRSYKDVSLELPRLIRNDIAIRATDEFMKKYNTTRTMFTYNDRDINSLMEAMQLLRRMTAGPKLEQCLEIIEDIPQAVIFTWYKATAKAIAQILEIPCITGEVPASDRKTVAQAKGLIVATMASLSEGVDLSHLKNVVFFEGDYVPARLHQALSRVRRHREGFEPVKATFLYVKDTIDEIVYHAANRRNVTIREVMKEALYS